MEIKCMTAKKYLHRFIGLYTLLTFGTLVSAQPVPVSLDSVWEKNIRKFNPPADTSKIAEWRQSLINWRTNELKKYNGAVYQKPGYEWVSASFVTCFFVIHDALFYNQQTGNYNVKGFIDYCSKRYGKLDAVIMWHLSPQIGFDDRNQFDFFRNMPGGLKGLRKVVDEFHQRGIKFFINHNPANEGAFKTDNLRPESETDASGGPQAMANIVRAIDADGVFLNTYAYGGAALQAELDNVKPGIVIEGETDLKNANDVQNQHMEWFQGWFSLPYFPGGVIRNKWLERKHMLHQVYRNTKDHTKELQAAWMNGTGMVVWENVFGIWRGWNERDKSLLRSMAPVQRRYADLFSGKGWIPIVPVLLPDLYANLWQGDGIRLWTIINNANETKQGELIIIDVKQGERYFDLIKGKEINAVAVNGRVSLYGSMNKKGIAGFIAVSAGKVDKAFEMFLAAQAKNHMKENLSTEFGPLPVILKKVIPTKKYRLSQLPKNMVVLNDTAYTQTDTVRRRESGTYDNDTFEGGGTTYRKVNISKFAIDEKPVTNAQFQIFIETSRYHPKVKENFLKHWVNGKPIAGKENEPVVYVDIDDARAYAKWAGKRLPVLEEWQYAMETGKVKYADTRVWEWNESERNDGRVRFSMLKGGSDWAAKGSRFYSTGGPQLPTYSAKYMFMWPGLDRLSTIGFRCAADW